MQVVRWLLCAAIISTPAVAAQFQFSTLIRWGDNAGGGTNWEMAAGNTSGTWADTKDVGNHFSELNSGILQADRYFEIGFDKSKGEMKMLLYKVATPTGGSDEVKFNPANGKSTATNAIWTLPASAFFAQATVGPASSQIRVSNLALDLGTLSTLSPFQTTPMTVNQSNGVGVGTVYHNGDVVFVGDANGDWKLHGIVHMNLTPATGPYTTGMYNNSLQFGLTATASDVPEPLTSTLIGAGLLTIALCGRRRAQ